MKFFFETFPPFLISFIEDYPSFGVWEVKILGFFISIFGIIIFYGGKNVLNCLLSYAVFGLLFFDGFLSRNSLRISLEILYFFGLI